MILSCSEKWNGQLQKLGVLFGNLKAKESYFTQGVDLQISYIIYGESKQTHILTFQIICYYFISYCSEESSVSLITLLIFCAEGDNIPGVLLVTNQLNRWLNVIPTSVNETPYWKFPISWKLFFGNPPPITMY